jgi:hypothetical protein
MRRPRIDADARDTPMPAHRLFPMAFGSVDRADVHKVKRTGRTGDEVERLIGRLSGDDTAGLQRPIAAKTSVEAFFAQAPAMNPNHDRITGVVGGVRVEAVEDPLMPSIRRLDERVDERAKGKALEKILRA